jgi:LysR family glycine cleavage system transcriptional activator
MAPRKLAHLNALRTFDMVARCGGFAKAAEELGVTPGAVSQQIALLEDYYGVVLFQRENRRVSLTEEARAVLPEVRAAFDQLSAVTARLQARSGRDRLTVSAPPALAARWLAPRLARFAEASGLKVDLEASDRLTDFRRDEADVAVRYGRGGWKGVQAEKLADETLTPACSPAWLAGSSVRTPADLVTAPLIHDRAMAGRADFPTWPAWFAAAGVQAAHTGPALSFSASAAAVQAAVDGHGVVLARSAVIADDLSQGRLVTPFAEVTLPGWSYFLVTPEAPSAPAAAFRDWLAAEFAA